MIRPTAAAPTTAALARAAEPASLAASEAVTAAADAQAAQEDDDAVIVPAAPMEYLGHTPVQPHRHKAQARKFDLDSMKFRRTTIPIFLTAGGLLLVAGFVRCFVGSDAPLSDLPRWFIFLAWGAAAVMFAGAMLNMLRVRHQLARSPLDVKACALQST